MLVLLLSAGQFVCLAGAVVYFAGHVRSTTHDLVRKRILHSSQQFAAQVAQRIGTMGLTDREQLQRLVEITTLPDDGFLCVIDAADGRVVCHPDIEHDQRVAGMQLGALELTTFSGPRSILAAGAASEQSEPETGWTQLDGETHIIAVAALPELGVYLLAHHPEAAMRVAIDELVSRIFAGGLLVACVLTGLLAAVTTLILQRYDNRLEIRNEHLNELVEERSLAVIQTRSAVILGMAKLAESRDDETGEHLERIRSYVRLLGDALIGVHPEVTSEFVDTITETSALHDIGKVGIPDRVLLKPGRLTDEEYKEIQRHPLIGGDALLAVKRQWGENTFLVTACEIAFAHHEKYDGSGYPFGLAADVIPLSARIVAVADVYDALTSKRVYKDAMSHEDAARVIEEGRGSHFDPLVVDAFHKIGESFRTVSEQATARKDRDQPTTWTDVKPAARS